MALLEWRDEFRTGIEGVDHEHEALIEQINAVYALIGEGADRQDVIDGLGEIYGSISAHFALEERMMLRHGYADYDQHQQDHERLLDEIREISDEFEASAQLDDARLARKLADWFQLHFKTHDSRLHKMATMRDHETVNRTTLKSLIQDAKDRFINRA
jgi:hemerythrin-like metal-binding protein